MSKRIQIINYLIVISNPLLQIGHDSIMDPSRISPPNTPIGRSITHVLSLIPPHTCHRHVTPLPISLPPPHPPLLPIALHKHHPHLIFRIRVRQVDLFRSMARPKPNPPGLGQQVGRPGERIVVMVVALGVDLGLGPAEDTEGVVRAEVDEG